MASIGFPAGSPKACAKLAKLIKQGRLGPEIAVTSCGRYDGVGGQASAAISAMRLARFAKCRYLHSPFSYVSHHVGSGTEWAERWERFVNLGDGEDLVPEGAEVVPIVDVVRDPVTYAGRAVIIGGTDFHLPWRGVARLQNALQPALRSRYWRAAKTGIPVHRGPAGSVTIAVHLRRGDVSETRNQNRYVADEQVLRSIEELRAALAPLGRPLRINLYSEGTAESFQAFAAAGCDLHISTSPFETFHNMVIADVLLLGRGNYSQVAGILSEGVVVIPPRAWNNPSPLWSQPKPEHWSNWLNRREDGALPARELWRAILARAGWLERQQYRLRRLWQRWA